MAYQDTGKHVVAFMILALVLSFAALIALGDGCDSHHELSANYAETRTPGANGNHR
jgi:hypothetical protein